MKREELFSNYYTVNSLIFLIFIILFTVSEFITHFVDGMFGFLLYADWMMIFIMLLMFMKFKGSIQKNVRNFFITLMALPMIRIVTIIFPFPELDMVYQIIIIYMILLLMALLYIRTLNHDIKHLFGNHFMMYAPIISLVVLGVGFVLFTLTRPYFNLGLNGSLIYILSVLLALSVVSFANALYFRGILQYMGEKVMAPTNTIILIAFMSVILLISQKSMVLLVGFFILNVIFGIVFHETKNLNIMIIAEFVFNAFYLTIFPTLL